MKNFAIKHDLAATLPDRLTQAFFLAVASKESGLKMKQANPKSSAYGYLQILRPTYHKALSNIMKMVGDDANDLRLRFRELGAINVDPRYHSEITRQKVLDDPLASMLIADLFVRYYTSEFKRYTGGLACDSEVTVLRCLNLFHHDWLYAKEFCRDAAKSLGRGKLTEHYVDTNVIDVPGKPMRADDRKMKRFAVAALDAIAQYDLYRLG